MTDNHNKTYKTKSGTLVPRSSEILGHCMAPDDAAGLMGFAVSAARRGLDWTDELDRWSEVGTHVHAIAEDVLRRYTVEADYQAPGPDRSPWQDETVKKCVDHLGQRDDAKDLWARPAWGRTMAALADWFDQHSGWEDFGDDARHVVIGAVSFALWLDDALTRRNLRPFLVEAVSVSERFGFGCTSDLVANIDGHESVVILDFKTGTPKVKDYLQMAANAVAFGECRGFTVSAAGPVYLAKGWGRKPHLGSTVGPRFNASHLWSRAQLVNGWEQFRHGLELYRLRQDMPAGVAS